MHFTNSKLVVSEWLVEVCLVVTAFVALSMTTVDGVALRDDFEERQIRQPAEMESDGSDRHKMAGADNDLCRTVCHFCRNVLGLRWTALCNVQCQLGGREYDACMTVWAVKEELYKIGY